MIDVSTPLKACTAVCENAFHGLSLRLDVRHNMVDASTQTSDVAVSENQNPNTSIPRISSQTKDAVVANSALSNSPALEGSTNNTGIEVETQTPGVLFHIGTPSEATLIGTPTESLSPSMLQQEYGEDEIQPQEDLLKVTFNSETSALINAALNQIMSQRLYEDPAAVIGLEKQGQEESRRMNPIPEVEDIHDGLPLEETGYARQSVVASTAAPDASTMVQEALLRAEEAAHWETREHLSRLDGWCTALEDENTRLQLAYEDAERENARMQRQLDNAEDESTGFQTRLSGAEVQIQEFLNSIKGYLSVIEGLRAQVGELNASVSWYFQLGINFYLRLQKAKKLLNPHDQLFAEYERLMSDAAQYFYIPANAGDENFSNGYDQDDFVRVQELLEVDENEEDGGNRENDQGSDPENEQEVDQENDGAPMLGISKLTCNHMSASEVDAFLAEEDIAPLDDDDTTYTDRPMRPGTANRVPVSVFAVRSGHETRIPSSPISENSAQHGQQAPSPPAPVFPISHDFSGPSIKLEDKFKTTVGQEPAQGPAHNAQASKASAHGRQMKGGIERGRGRSGRGTHRGRMPLRGGRSTRSGKGTASSNAGSDLSPASSAFPINYGFSEPSVNTNGKG